MTEHEKYFNRFRSFAPEDMIDYIYFIGSSEELFWLSLFMIEQSNNCCWSIHERNVIYSAAIRELLGLKFIGFIDQAHDCIIRQYDIAI